MPLLFCTRQVPDIVLTVTLHQKYIMNCLAKASELTTKPFIYILTVKD